MRPGARCAGLLGSHLGDTVLVGLLDRTSPRERAGTAAIEEVRDEGTAGFVDGDGPIPSRCQHAGLERGHRTIRNVAGGRYTTSVRDIGTET